MVRSDWRSASSDLKIALTFVGSSPNFARSWYRMKFGIAIAARMPMIATTIMSSMSVKPFADFFMVPPLQVRRGARLATPGSRPGTSRPKHVGASGRDRAKLAGLERRTRFA